MPMPPPAKRLAGKVAFITGASRGIGKAIAVEFARDGADVAVVARTVERKDWIPGTIHETAAAVKALGRRALAVQADLTDRADVERSVKETLDAFGKVDILVNNAVFMGKAAYYPIWETTPKAWDLQVALNLTAPYVLTSLLAPRMKAQGGGLIINVSSGSAYSGSEHPGIGYGTTKAALNRMTELLARQMGSAKIAVVTLDPGFTRTEIAEIGAAGAGRDAKDAHPVDVPARTAWHLATCKDPMWYSGRIVVAANHVREHNLWP